MRNRIAGRPARDEQGARAKSTEERERPDRRDRGGRILGSSTDRPARSRAEQAGAGGSRGEAQIGQGSASTESSGRRADVGRRAATRGVGRASGGRRADRRATGGRRAGLAPGSVEEHLASESGEEQQVEDEEQTNGRRTERNKQCRPGKLEDQFLL